MENYSNFNITYPSVHPGTDVTQIEFHTGTPDLRQFFLPGKNNSQKRCFVTDATVATLPYMQTFVSQFDDGRCGSDLLIILGSGEPYKTIESVLSIVETALENGFSRNDLFVGIGGGVICDLTGFAASLYKRGAAVQFVPTTLLSMVDASIGGKTGCDFKSYKNMIGSFFPAQKICYFPEFISTLSEAQFRSGLAEAFKTALLYDAELSDMFRTKSSQILSREPEIICTIIQKCAKAKAEVVEKDFTEKNIRKYLNLGHTFGHALETLAGLGTVTHGDAVAWGIGRAVSLSAKLDFCKESYKDEVLHILSLYGWDINPVPKIASGGGISERLIQIMHKDKKNKSDKISIVLQRGLTDTFTQEVEDGDILPVLR